MTKSEQGHADKPSEPSLDDLLDDLCGEHAGYEMSCSATETRGIDARVKELRAKIHALVAPSAGGTIDAYAVRRAMQEFPAEHQTAGLLVTLKAAISTYLACVTATPSAREASGDGVTIPARLAAHLHGALSDAPLTKKCGVCQEIVALVAPQASIGPTGDKHG